LGRHVVKNPVRVYAEKVDLRDSKGRYTTFSKAAKFFVTIEGVRLEFDIPKFRPKTSAKVKNFVDEVVIELKSQFYAQDLRVEDRRKRIPKKRLKKPTDKIKYEFKEYQTRYFSKKLKSDVVGKDFYFWFKPAYEISIETTEEIMDTVFAFSGEMMTKLIKNRKLKGWKYRIRVLGGGTYTRIQSGKKPTDDLFGYSIERDSVPNLKSELDADIRFLKESFIGKVLHNPSKFGNYFMRMAKTHIDKMGRKRLFIIRGVHLEFVKEA